MEDSTNQDLGTPLLPPPASAGEPQGSGDTDLESSTNSAVLSSPPPKRFSHDDNLDFESHFTLRVPTSTVHFRGSLLRVIDTDQDQIILQQSAEENGDDDDYGKKKRSKVFVKRLSPGTYAQRFLRVGYTLITILFLGFLFVFCFQVILFLFIALPVDSGYTSGGQGAHPVDIMSTLLSFPIMVYGMASLMAMGSAFVIDTYNGAALFRSTIVEVLYMCVFLVVPILTFAFSLMARDENPWRKTAGSWAVMVAITFTIWGLAVTYKQAEICLWLVEKFFCNEDVSSGNGSHDDDNNNQVDGESGKLMKNLKTLMKLAKQAVLLTQTARYSGLKKQRLHIMAGDDLCTSFGHEIQERHISLYSQFTTLPFCSNSFEKLDEPKKIYSSEEVREILPFMTKNNWSMQKMWCAGNSRQHSVVVAAGESALTSDQIKFSVFCTVASSVFLTLLIIGLLMWMELGTASYILVAVVSLLCCLVPIFRNSMEMYRTYSSLQSEDVDANEDGAHIFQVWETLRITEPKPWYCFARIIIEVVFLFLWPFIHMLVKKNYPVALVFFLLSSFTFLWHYFDSCAVLQEIGSISNAKDDSVTHKQAYRLNEVIGRIITNKGRRFWTWIFFIVAIAILFLFFTANGTAAFARPDQRGKRPPILLLDPDEFYYPGMDNTLAYPTCKLTKGFEFPNSESTDLGDYSFLSAMAYETSEMSSFYLNKWFGPDVVRDEDEFVSQYRKDSDTELSPVYFKLFSVPSAPGYAVMSIRGSETAFDWISNMQLWSAAGLAQVVKWLTPFGWVWEPILPDLIYLVNLVESEPIASVSYYKITTQFVNDVLGGYGESFGKDFTNIRVTGVSLGGGLAIITGAQTEAYAVAISGLGATLTRETVDPPIELEKLNSQTFNFIPERDFIARIGGRAPLFQNAECIAPKNDLFGCHSMWRSVCEINYRCGSNSRPVICRCVENFGYPKPVQNGTRTFEEACQDANTTWYEMFPP